ncbi:MAG: hypothetical protein OFPI_40430 [Osedax symbiont Rs2]|nr:MAG: hypothetical protein OFPI_40430 [Osedax symbiont Rs2]
MQAPFAFAGIFADKNSVNICCLKIAQKVNLCGLSEHE